MKSSRSSRVVSGKADGGIGDGRPPLMSIVLNGLAASEGIGFGPVHILSWGMPEVPHENVTEDRVEEEVRRFHEAREWARGRLGAIKARTEALLGPVEARIFDPQILMLDDAEIVDGTALYIRENHLTAPRAFEWRMMELQAMLTRRANPMVLDKLNDLEDLQVRLLNRMLGLPDPSDFGLEGSRVILVAPNLTPSLTVHLDPSRILGVATDHGTRTSHWAILARSLEIPAVVGLGVITAQARSGQEAILDGRIGHVVLDPDERDREVFEERRSQLQGMEDDIQVLASLESVTRDGQPVALRANLDLPEEADNAALHGAEGVGLYRTEFLVVGRAAMPGEEEQFLAYRQVAKAFPQGAIYIRTFDVGGDKFPIFLHMPAEENPFLGWRAIRVCLDEPELFRTQLRAILRASAFGDLRIMLPLVNDAEEIRRTRVMLEEEEDRLDADSIQFNSGYKLGIMIETPAAALEAVELARYSDFFSIGTNDLVQYTLAVDRTNARLAHLYNPFHPAVVRQLFQVARVGRAAGIEVSVCGELAANPLGTFLLLGLDITAMSVAWPALPEVKHVIRSVRMEDARVAARKALAAPNAEALVKVLVDGIGDSVDLSAFSGRWNLSP
jgi:phosphotransferase system enzyme I (PtsI)